MRDVIYIKLDIAYLINQQLNKTISRKSYFFETVKSKVIISLFETVRSVSISPRNLYNSLKSIKEKRLLKATLYSPKIREKKKTIRLKVRQLQSVFRAASIVCTCSAESVYLKL